VYIPLTTIIEHSTNNFNGASAPNTGGIMETVKYFDRIEEIYAKRLQAIFAGMDSHLDSHIEHAQRMMDKEHTVHHWKGVKQGLSDAKRILENTYKIVKEAESE